MYKQRKTIERKNWGNEGNLVVKFIEFTKPLETIIFIEKFEMTAKSPINQRPTVKVILVGNSGVGKTCLIAAFYKQAFDNKTQNTVAPAYSYYDVKNSRGVNIRLQIWDTAGQERYSSVSQLFYRDSDVALICFDVEESSSISAIPDWVKKVRDEVPHCTLFFVLTKADLKSAQEIEQIQSEAMAVIQQYEPNTIYVTSALTKEGVNAVFEAASDLYKPKGASLVQSQTLSKDPPSKPQNGCC